MASNLPPDKIRPARKVPCPTCGQPSAYAPENPWRPFCSERCRGVDLGAWANERYRVGPAPDPSEDADDDSKAH